MTGIIDQSLAAEDGETPYNPGPGPRAQASSPSRLAALRRLRTGKFITGFSLVAVIVLFAIFGPLFVRSPRAVSNIGLAGPTGEHLLGTNATGQDLLAQLAYASRGSLFIGVLVGAMSLAFSAFFGILGAYVGGVVEEVFSLFTNVMLIIPGLPLMIVIASYVQKKSVFLVAFVLAITSWAAGARVLSAQTQSLRNRDYVLAARVSD